MYSGECMQERGITVRKVVIEYTDIAYLQGSTICKAVLSDTRLSIGECKPHNSEYHPRVSGGH